jgi:fused signal recognition particle receptor
MKGLCAFLAERAGIACGVFAESPIWLALGVILIVLLAAGFLVVKRVRRRRRESGPSEGEPAQREPLREEEDTRRPLLDEVGLEENSSLLRAAEQRESGLLESQRMEAAEEPESIGLEPGPGVPFVDRLRVRLARTQAQFIGRIDRLLLKRKSLDSGMLEDLEEILVEADLGLKTTRALLEELEKGLSDGGVEGGDLVGFLKTRILGVLSVPCEPMDVGRDKPFVIMVVGVNGVGKTTTIGKLAGKFVRQGRKVMLVAADTFRAAAIEQLEIWSHRTGSDFVRHKAGADPGGVVFDAMRAAEARGTDVVMVDTAGRLHTKTNLMEELKKIKRVMQKQRSDAPHEVLLVVDATTGQNAIQQARVFHEALGVTGVVLTKLDGSAKGGVIVGIAHELQIPVRYIGIGEKEEDLAEFEPLEFVEALFHKDAAGYTQ